MNRVATAPIETKVKAATSAAAASAFVLWLLGEYVFAGEVPAAVSGLIILVVPGLVTFLAGYLARHTARPSDPTGPPQHPPVVV